MGAAGVLGAAYSMMVDLADAQDQTAQLVGDKDALGQREGMDEALGMNEETLEQELYGRPEDQTGDPGNVIQLAAWVAKVNQLMSD
jgi:hypothetical protein